MIWIWKTVTLLFLEYSFSVMIFDIIFTSGIFLLLYLAYVNGERRK